MNRVPGQLLQTTIPAAIGYAIGRSHSASNKENKGALSVLQGETLSIHHKPPQERMRPAKQNSIRDDRSSSSQTAAPDYPSKDFLPFIVPNVDYVGRIKSALGTGRNQQNDSTRND